jgi:hypothetical protein
MSKQTSLVKFTGKMGGISFYKQDGVHVARQTGGPAKERILNDPRFARTRENMSEFAGMAQAASSLTRIFAPVKNLKDNKLRLRATRLLRSMMKLHDGPRGQRDVLITQHRASLLGLELNVASQFKTVFVGKFVATHSADRKTATINMAELRANTMITAPVGATHFQLVQLAGVLADAKYNLLAKGYLPSDAALNGVANVTFSDYLSLGNAEPVPVNLQTVLPVDLNEHVSVVQALGILFFSKNGAIYYPAQQGKGMLVVDVY